jgi:hypothetical protein
MGTLFSQDPRRTLKNYDTDIIALIENVKAIAKKTDLSIDQVLKAYEIKETERRTDFLIQNGDIHDEQMTGFGELVKDVTNALVRISDNLGE